MERGKKFVVVSCKWCGVSYRADPEYATEQDCGTAKCFGSRSHKVHNGLPKFKQCSKCGYNRYPIHHRHHKNRNRKDNKPENIELLCPNCHNETHFETKTGFWTNRIEEDGYPCFNGAIYRDVVGVLDYCI